MNNIDIINYPRNKYCSIYDKDNELIVFTNNDLLFEYVMYQIAKDNINGCYIIFDNGKRYDIDSYGSISDWPDGLFDNITKLKEKIQLQIAKNIFNDVDNQIKLEDLPIDINEDVLYELVIRPNGEKIN